MRNEILEYRISMLQIGDNLALHNISLDLTFNFHLKIMKIDDNDIIVSPKWSHIRYIFRKDLIRIGQNNMLTIFYKCETKVANKAAMYRLT